jgi:hypothetical protein
VAKGEAKGEAKNANKAASTEKPQTADSTPVRKGLLTRIQEAVHRAKDTTKPKEEKAKDDKPKDEKTAQAKASTPTPGAQKSTTPTTGSQQASSPQANSQQSTTTQGATPQTNALGIAPATTPNDGTPKVQPQQAALTSPPTTGRLTGLFARRFGSSTNATTTPVTQTSPTPAATQAKTPATLPASMQPTTPPNSALVGPAVLPGSTTQPPPIPQGMGQAAVARPGANVSEISRNVQRNLGALAQQVRVEIAADKTLNVHVQTSSANQDAVVTKLAQDPNLTAGNVRLHIHLGN